MSKVLYLSSCSLSQLFPLLHNSLIRDFYHVYLATKVLEVWLHILIGVRIMAYEIFEHYMLTSISRVPILIWACDVFVDSVNFVVIAFCILTMLEMCNISSMLSSFPNSNLVCL